MEEKIRKLAECAETQQQEYKEREAELDQAKAQMAEDYKQAQLANAQWSDYAAALTREKEELTQQLKQVGAASQPQQGFVQESKVLQQVRAELIRERERARTAEQLLVTLDFQHEAHGDVHRPRRWTVLQPLKPKLHSIRCN